MGKSSSSLKKIKHSRDSSKLRSVKKKKKTKRNKTKKIRRIKDYSDESESSGSDSSSSLYSSSSEDGYRRKKKRRSKVIKKRSRKRYFSSEGDDDCDDYDNGDDTGLVKKKKRSKRKDEHVGKTKKKKKKISSRKRRKRDSSSSATSSSEQSNDGSESDGKRRSRDRERLGKVRDVRRRSRDELEEDIEPDECWQVEDEVIPEMNRRRLKSIIVVSCSYGNDERKEEDDHDVYMTRGGDRDLGYSEDSDERDVETTISYARARADDYGRKTVGDDEFEESKKSETSKYSHLDNSMKDDDLEAILKQRALENLKRFRGATQKSEIARKEVSSVSEGQPLQTESEKVEESQEDYGLMEQKLCVSAGSKDLETSQKILQVVNVKESGTALANIASQQDQQSGDTTKAKASSGISSCTAKRKLIRPVLGQEGVNLASMKKVSGCQDAEAESINGSTIDKNLPESSLAQATKNGSENIEPTKLSSTLKAHSSSHADTETLDEIKGGSQSEQKTMDETKDESQYEQKTMTVMRGGELVQVSYKVYIPKKTSSLGRRQFKR